jgi:hypothetical protein
MDIHQANHMTNKVDVDEDNIHEYTDNKHHRHGKLGQIKTEDIIELQETRKNFDNLNKSVEKGKEIMYKFTFKSEIATDVNLPISEYVFNYINDILIFQHKNEKLRINKYLFNIKTGEVYYINKILMEYININKYHEYDKIIKDGIPSALEEINFIILFSSDFAGN